MNDNLEFVRDLILKKESNLGFRVPPQTMFSDDLSSDVRLIVYGPLLYIDFYLDSVLITYHLDFRFSTYRKGASIGSHREDGKKYYDEFPNEYFDKLSDWQKLFI